MIVRGFISHRFLKTCLVTIISDEGNIMNIFECNYNKAKQFAHDRMKEHYQLEWVDSPWSDFNVQESKRLYEENWFISFDGKTQ